MYPVLLSQLDCEWPLWIHKRTPGNVMPVNINWLRWDFQTWYLKQQTTCQYTHRRHPGKRLIESALLKRLATRRRAAATIGSRHQPLYGNLIPLPSPSIFVNNMRRAIYSLEGWTRSWMYIVEGFSNKSPIPSPEVSVPFAAVFILCSRLRRH